MKNLILQRMFLRFAVAVSIGFTALPAGAQCVSGMGATPLKLATGNWASPIAPLDFTSMTSPTGAGTSGIPSLPVLTDLATDGSNVFVLGNRNILVTRLNGTQLELVESLNVALPFTPMNLYSAGNTGVWAASSGGQLMSLNALMAHVDPVSSIALSTGGLTVGGAASDGMYAWFSANNGSLYKVRPPTIVQGGGNTDSGSLVGAVKISQNALGAMAFDGQSLWIASGANIIQFNPSTNEVMGTFSIGGAPSSITFDGVYLWIGNSQKAVMTKFDPIKGGLGEEFTRGAGADNNILFDGSMIWTFDATNASLTKSRACDGSANGTTALPGQPLKAIFDGYRTWIIYQKSNIISIR